MKILRQRTKDLEVKKFCISLLDAAGSFQYTKKVLRELDDQIVKEIARIGENPILSRVMDDLRKWQ